MVATKENNRDNSEIVQLRTVDGKFSGKNKPSKL